MVYKMSKYWGQRSKILAGLSCLTLVFGCTSIHVNPVQQNPTQPIVDICIVNNDQVIIKDFVPAIQKRLKHHLIFSRVVIQNHDRNCEYKLYYSAKQSWDFVNYLSWAELKLYKDNKLVADAEYNHVGKSFSLSPLKFQSVETKMNPVIDKLLGQTGGEK